MTDTSLMMVTYNRLDLTKRMLDNLLKVTKRPFNLVIVDNGSEDGTKEYLVEFAYQTINSVCMNVALELNEENKGIAIGRNQTMKIVDDSYPDTKWYCTIDNDVEVPENWLNDCISVMQKNPKYGMIGVNMERKMYSLVTSNGVTFQHKPQGNLGTACMVFPQALHRMLGFFNTEYGKYGEEDADWGMRARVVGYQLGYIKEMGNHFGEGENDQGEYREYKTACHKKNLAKFNANCRAYAQRAKSIHIPYKDE
jgi:GT2 family glycosyltransferase